MRLSTKKKVTKEVGRQVKNKKGNRSTEFELEERVWAKNFGRDASRWSETIIREKIRPVTYKVEWLNGGADKRHLDQIVNRSREENSGGQSEELSPERLASDPVRRSERLKTRGQGKL